MKKNKVLLILTADYGDGHLKAAKGIENGIRIQDPTVEIHTVNLFHEAHPLINKTIKNTYLKCYSKSPQIYDFLYYFTKDIKTNYYLNNVVGMFGRRTLKRYLKEINPDLVINTFPVLAMPIMYKKKRTNIPCYTVITDYGVHSQWIDPGISKYFVGHEFMIEQLVSQGVEKEKIEVTGIPVMIDASGVDRENLVKKYELIDPKMPIVTLLAGAHGVLGNLHETVASLYQIKPEAQLIIACGKNAELKEKVQKEAEKFGDRIKVHGFLDNIHEVMRGSDILITKAGGITTTEALNMGVPLIIFGSPAGQEKENTEFLTKSGCAYYARNHKELIPLLTKLLNNTEMIKSMAESIENVRRPEGAVKIAKTVFNRLQEKA